MSKAERSERISGVGAAPPPLGHTQCGEDVEHEGDVFCSLKFRGDLLKSHMLSVDIGKYRMSDAIHRWIEDDIMKLALIQFKTRGIDDPENYRLLSWTIGCEEVPSRFSS